MPITEQAALAVISLEAMKEELRIPAPELEHDALITRQIVDAVSHVSMRTGAAGDDLLPLRAAAASIVRALYDGDEEITVNAAHNALMRPFESYEAG